MTNTKALLKLMIDCDTDIKTLAKETSIPYANLRRKILGETSFKVSEMFKVAESLGITPGELGLFFCN